MYTFVTSVIKYESELNKTAYQASSKSAIIPPGFCQKSVCTGAT